MLTPNLNQTDDKQDTATQTETETTEARRADTDKQGLMWEGMQDIHVSGQEILSAQQSQRCHHWLGRDDRIFRIQHHLIDEKQWVKIKAYRASLHVGVWRLCKQIKHDKHWKKKKGGGQRSRDVSVARTTLHQQDEQMESGRDGWEDGGRTDQDGRALP